MSNRWLFLSELCVEITLTRVRNKTIHSLPLIKIFLLTREVICQWFSLVTSSLVKIIGKSPHSWPKNLYSRYLMHYSILLWFRWLELASEYLPRGPCLLTEINWDVSMEMITPFVLNPPYVGPVIFRDAIWRQRSGSTLAQVMVRCLTAPSHHLNQWWDTISGFLWHSPQWKSTARAQDINPLRPVKISFKVTATSPRGLKHKIYQKFGRHQIHFCCEHYICALSREFCWNKQFVQTIIHTLYTLLTKCWISGEPCSIAGLI